MSSNNNSNPHSTPPDKVDSAPGRPPSPIRRALFTARKEPEIPSGIETLARTINTSWKRTNAAIVETAIHCAAANNLSPDEKAQLIAELNFSAATFSKLATIGEATHLHEPTTLSILPNGYSLMYELASLDRIQFAFAMKDSLINQEMTRAAIIRLKGGTNNTSPPHDTRILGTIQALPSLDRRIQPQILERLQTFCEINQCKFDRIKDESAKALEKIERSVAAFVRQEARRYVRTQKKAKGKKWAFALDEVAIANVATKREIETVLNFIGGKEEFKRISREAEDLSQTMLDEWAAKYAPDESAEFGQILSGLSDPT